MRFLIFTPLLFLFNDLLAQEPVAGHSIGWRGNSIEVHSIADKAKQLVCTVVLNDDSVKGYLMDAAAKSKEVFAIARLNNEQLLGGFFRNDKLYLFFENKVLQGLHNLIINPGTHEVKQIILPFDTNRERIIDRISCGDHFLYFTVNKKTSEFIIYDFNSEINYTITKYGFERNLWKELTSGSGVSAEKVDFEGDCSLDVAAAKSKIYFHNDTVYLLLNKVKGISRVFRFSLPDQKVDMKTIFHVKRDRDGLVPPFFVDNAFMLKEKLYHVYAIPDSLVIQVTDVNTLKQVNSFRVKKEDEITFKNTPIIEEGTRNFSSKKKERELDKTRQLVRKMVGGGAVIMATMNDKNQVEVSVGSYTEVSGGGGYAGMRGVSSPAAVGGGMTYIPTGSFSRGTWVHSVRFKMLLDPVTGEHIPGEMKPSINEAVEDYTKDIKIPAEAENLFLCDGKYYYAYYDKKERTLSFVRF